MKAKKKANKKIKMTSLFITVTVFLFIINLAVSIFLKSYNQSLTKQIAVTNQQIVQLKAEVDTITIQVDQLSEQSRVMDIVSDGSMAYIENNITTISN